MTCRLIRPGRTGRGRTAWRSRSRSGRYADREPLRRSGYLRSPAEIPHSFGGLKISPKAQVLNSMHEPIRGLCAGIFSGCSTTRITPRSLGQHPQRRDFGQNTAWSSRRLGENLKIVLAAPEGRTAEPCLDHGPSAQVARSAPDNDVRRALLDGLLRPGSGSRSRWDVDRDIPLPRQRRRHGVATPLVPVRLARSSRVNSHQIRTRSSGLR